MKYEITGTFIVSSWDESEIKTFETETKFAKTSVKQIYSGELDAESTLEYLLYYLDKSSTRFSGFERVSGQLSGKSGTFILQHEGNFNHGVASSRFTVLEGSGTEDLAGLKGRGSYKASHTEANYYIQFEL